MEKISRTRNYYLSVDGINHTPIKLDSCQCENINFTNLYCLLMFTSQFNNRKELIRYLKDLELVPEDHVSDYIAIVNRHTKNKKEYYKDTHLRIFYKKDIGYFNEEVFIDFIFHNIGNPLFDTCFYNTFERKERDPLTGATRSINDVAAEKELISNELMKKMTYALSKENEKIYEDRTEEPSGFSKEDLQNQNRQILWEIQDLNYEEALLFSLRRDSRNRKTRELTEKEEQKLLKTVTEFVLKRTRRKVEEKKDEEKEKKKSIRRYIEEESKNKKDDDWNYNYIGFIWLTNFTLNAMYDSKIHNYNFYIPKPKEEKTETYLAIEKSLKMGSIFNVVNSQKHEKKYYDLPYINKTIMDMDINELYNVFKNIENISRYSRKKEYKIILKEIVYIIEKIKNRYDNKQSNYIEAFNILMQKLVKNFKYELISYMNMINRNNGFEIKEDRSDKMPSSFKDMSPDVDNEEIEYKEKFEDDGYAFDEIDNEVIVPQSNYNRRSNHPYIDRNYYLSIINSKDIKAIKDLYTEIEKITEDKDLKTDIKGFLNFLRNAFVDENGRFYSNDARTIFDSFIKGFDQKWEEIESCIDVINEVYNLEKPKSY